MKSSKHPLFVFIQGMGVDGAEMDSGDSLSNIQTKIVLKFMICEFGKIYCENDHSVRKKKP